MSENKGVDWLNCVYTQVMDITFYLKSIQYIYKKS